MEQVGPTPSPLASLSRSVDDSTLRHELADGDCRKIDDPFETKVDTRRCSTIWGDTYMTLLPGPKPTFDVRRFMSFGENHGFSTTGQLTVVCQWGRQVIDSRTVASRERILKAAINTN